MSDFGFPVAQQIPMNRNLLMIESQNGSGPTKRLIKNQVTEQQSLFQNELIFQK